MGYNIELLLTPEHQWIADSAPSAAVLMQLMIIVVEIIIMSSSSRVDSPGDWGRR